MLVDQDRAAELLRAFDFKSLFVDELGWDRCPSGRACLDGDGAGYSLEAVAEKRGVKVFLCSPDGHDGPPPYRVRQQVDRHARKLAYEHLLVFVDAARTTQVWQWVDKEPGRSAVYREYPYRTSQSGLSLIQKLESIAFPLSEEEALTISGVTLRLRDAFDRDKVTKSFYERFQKEQKAFSMSIEGIRDQTERAWYSSVMLNRLMFVYFVQKKGFLAGDADYLRHRLRRVREERGAGVSPSFYRHFLLRLFHEGLGSQFRSHELDDLLGKVPYLNGGLFDVHELERSNSGIDIHDDAFERLFDFFEAYRWHLDERPLAADNEINPDVLGYIFEKYINQKQMGAYYTKEDVTGFIASNTIVPALLHCVEKQCPTAFAPGSAAWGLLQADADRYIPVVTGMGCDQELPGDVAAGVESIAERMRWNELAGHPYGLPTETWREVVARRLRYEEVAAALSSGAVASVSDLVTENVDVPQFAQDFVEACQQPDVRWSVWKALVGLAVLDPACGSGAFLFAALSVLQPLYEGCLERMRGFLEEAGELSMAPETAVGFRTVLDDVAAHPNARYYVLKSIVINNLFGVDLMEEAVEITKLRLFLKLVAQIDSFSEIEPLPDIDFSVRAGNSLVGFLSYEEAEATISARLDFSSSMAQIKNSAQEVTELFTRFREMQTKLPLPTAAFREIKKRLSDGLSSLQGCLDRYLASDSGIDDSDQVGYGKWRSVHKPFHWFTEFHEVIARGGFDVVIGNPPYVSTKRIDYRLESDGPARYPDIYAYFMERAIGLTRDGGFMGLIVPLSLTFSRDFAQLRNRLETVGPAWFSSYDNIPAAVFSGVSQRCTIWLGRRAPGAGGLWSAPMYRWRSEYRPALMARVAYAPVLTSCVTTWGIPKAGDSRQAALLRRVQDASTLGAAYRRSKTYRIGFSQTARNFISSFIDDPPCLDAVTLETVAPSKIGHVGVPTQEHQYAGLAALTGELHFWHWLVRGDGFDVTSWIVEDFLACLNTIDVESISMLARLGQAMHNRRYEALVYKKNAGIYVGNFNYRRIPFLTRRADAVLASALGLSRNGLLSVLDHVQRVLSINVFAGEKSIPDEVRMRFTPEAIDEETENRLLREVDAVLIERLDLSAPELDALLRDVVVLGV